MKTLSLILIFGSLLAATLYYLTQTKELPARPELPSKRPEIANTSSFDALRDGLAHSDRIMDEHLAKSDAIVDHNYGVFKVTLVIVLAGAIMGGTGLLLHKTAKR